MRLAALLMVCSLASAALADEPKREAAAEKFTVPGMFSVDTPAGYQWTEAKAVEINGVRIRIYACAKKGGVAQLSLRLEEHSANDAAARVAEVKANYGALLQTVGGAGVLKLKPNKPQLEPPISDRVAYGASGLTEARKPISFQCLTVFGKFVYVFQASGPSDEEAAAMLKVADSLKEAEPARAGK